MTEWHYSLNDEAVGPIKESELKVLKAQGVVTETTLVWSEGMTDWVALKDSSLEACDLQESTTAPDNPYAISPSALTGLGYKKETNYTLAGRFSRLLAGIIDYLLISTALAPWAFIVANTVAAWGSASSSNWKPSEMMIVIPGILLLLIFGINIILLYKSAQTIGKKIMGIKVANADSGLQASFTNVFWLRVMTFICILQVPFVGPFVLLLNPFFIFGEERRCLHDLVAGTIVIKSR